MILGVLFVLFFLKNKTCILQFYFLVMPMSKKIMGPLLAFFLLKNFNWDGRTSVSLAKSCLGKPGSGLHGLVLNNLISNYYYNWRSLKYRV